MYRRNTHSLWNTILCIIVLYLGIGNVNCFADEPFVMLQYNSGESLFQPIAIQETNEIDITNPQLYIDETGAVSYEVRKYISSILTDSSEILDMDVSEERIVLLLKRNDDVFLRIAYWNYAQDTYSIIDTKSIPLVTTLDTYHDGNAIFVNIPYQSLIREIDSESEELFITFENINGTWILTTCTDGQTFSATIKEKTYSVKLSASSEVDYDTARSNAKNADGNGIYEFKISNGVIKKISNIDWEKSNGELKTSTGRFPGAYAAIDIGAREKGFKEECIISLKDYNGDFNPQYVPWNALVNKQYTNLKYKIDEKMPTSDLFVIVDGMDSLRGDTTLFGIVINKETRYDPYTESIVNEYSFLTNGATKSMVFEEDKDPLKWNKNDIIEYYDGGGFKETGYMSIVSKDNLFPIDEPKGIGSVSYEKGGVYEGTSNNMVKVNNAGETQWYFLHSSYQVFEVVNKNKVKKSDLNSAIGKKVYFLKSKSRVYCIFYLND